MAEFTAENVVIMKVVIRPAGWSLASNRKT